MIGSSVKAKALIQSEDMSVGIDDGSLPIPAGTPGKVLGRGIDHLIVQFQYGLYRVTYDCLPEELEFVSDDFLEGTL